MADPPDSECHDVGPFMSLPAEIRRNIYYFAIVEPHPLPLIQIVRHRILDSYVRCYAVKKDLRMLETCKEFYTDMKNLLYSKTSFFISFQPQELEEGVKLFQIDLGRIEKCHICLNDITTWVCEDHENRDDHSCELTFIPEYDDLSKLVDTLIFKGYKIKYLLVECKPQVCEWLAEGLKRMAMLRKIHLVHFRSSQAEMYPTFRFLEDLMMSDRPLPFKTTREDFEEDLYEYDYLLRSPDMGGDDVPGNAVVKSEEQMEATAKELYSILGIKRDFVAQSELGEPGDDEGNGDGDDDDDDDDDITGQA